ncbi:MAG: Gfo/Idh/MocA family oxidoreductase [Pyrinomonadaceae bacterium]
MATAKKDSQDKKKKAPEAKRRKIRYAVIGLGHIAQVAVLPAFAHAKKNSELVALVSSDQEKLKKLGRKYAVKRLVPYEGYDELLRSGDIDAVYIALPNQLHREYTISAARAGVHVLCEKPMAVTDKECEQMIRAADEGRIKLMIAYRLHFEAANMKAVEMARTGKLGDVRIFNSTFTMQVKPDNIRLKTETGGGTLYDIGIYCINAARYIFRSEPTEVLAMSATGDDDKRFTEVEEMVSASLRFPGDRIAAFTCSFGASSVSTYQIVGTKGTLRADPAYDYAGELKLNITSTAKNRSANLRNAISSPRRSLISRSVCLIIASPSLPAAKGSPMCASSALCIAPRKPASP